MHVIPDILDIRMIPDTLENACLPANEPSKERSKYTYYQALPS